MNKSTAHAILNQVKLGMHFTEAQVLQALYVTGDLDIHTIAPRTCKSIYARSTDLGDCLSWSEDWKRKRNLIEGVKK